LKEEAGNVLIKQAYKSINIPKVSDKAVIFCKKLVDVS
jgi:hypothetical protein